MFKYVLKDVGYLPTCGSIDTHPQHIVKMNLFTYI